MPPVQIQDPTEAACYVAERFWNPYLAAAEKDSSLYSIDEQKFISFYRQYIEVLNMLEKNLANLSPDKQARARKITANSHKSIIEAADSLYTKGHRTLLTRLISLSEKFLYNPNSPLLNEELYIPALEAILNLKSIDTLHKMQHVYQLKMALLNRTGTKANDFSYEYINTGASADTATPALQKERTTLYKTPAKYLLIYFNDPDCASCKEMQQILIQDPEVNRLLNCGDLRVLSLYLSDNTTIWEERFKNVPSNWIYARDYKKEMESNELYGIRAIPSMYLLDKDKKVLLKDAPAERIIAFFNQMTGAAL